MIAYTLRVTFKDWHVETFPLDYNYDKALTIFLKDVEFSRNGTYANVRTMEMTLGDESKSVLNKIELINPLAPLTD